MVEKKIKSYIPVYAAGLALVLFSIIFPMYKLMNLVIGAVVCLLVCLLSDRFAPYKTQMVEAPLKAADTGNEHLDKLITEGRTQLKEIERLTGKIGERHVMEDVEELSLYGNKIFNYLEEHPERASSVRQFMDYYLPTTYKLVQNYVTLKEQGSSGENVGKATEKIEEALDTVVVAFKKQFDNLFESKAMDIIADVNVMERLLKAGGLLDEDFHEKGGGQ